jgi:hypothetical protein
MKKYYSNLIALVFFVTLACQPQTNIDSIIVEKQSLENSFISTEIEPLDENDLEGDYSITIKFDKESDSNFYPSTLSICAINENATKRIQNDIVVYELITDNVTVKEQYQIALNERDSKRKQPPGFSIGCSVSFTTPGEFDENCGETCSDTSLLGGDTWFCVCLYDCSFEFDFS